jgi:hypothetical protein|tara:strand:- start:1284 stop:1811 length:528 start_codon:yes stop_codon:yes gene_type:complete
MSLRVDDLKAKLTGGGARPNLFKATINFPNYAGGNSDLTSFLCKAAQLPSSVIGQIDVPFRGRQLKVAGDRTFENWTVTIINEDAFEVRNSFERWANGINEHRNGTGILNPADYQSDLTIEQLNRQNETIKTINLRGAFPVNVAGIDLSYDTTDTLEEYTVEFAYQYWEAAGVTS